MNDKVEKLPTRRQFEVLVNIFVGDQSADGRRSRERYKWREGDLDVFIPAWGRPCQFSHVRGMGGAVHRMKEAMAEAGLLEYKIGRTVHTYVRDKLTLKALLVLKTKYPSLPNIEQRIADQRAADEAAAAEAEAERQAAKVDLQRRAVLRAEVRRERMAAVLQDFQVQHNLTDEQLVAMWLRVVEEETMKVD